MRKANQPSEGESELVSFRLDSEFRQLLQEEAKKHGHPKPNLFARKLVQEALTGSRQEEIKHELTTFGSELHRIREDIATLALALLVRVGKEDPKKALAWIREHLAP